MCKTSSSKTINKSHSDKKLQEKDARITTIRRAITMHAYSNQPYQKDRSYYLVKQYPALRIKFLLTYTRLNNVVPVFFYQPEYVLKDRLHFLVKPYRYPALRIGLLLTFTCLKNAQCVCRDSLPSCVRKDRRLFASRAGGARIRCRAVAASWARLPRHCWHCSVPGTAAGSCCRSLHTQHG